MRFQTVSPKDLNDDAFFRRPTLLVLTQASWDAVDWHGAIPRKARDRVVNAAARLMEPLKAGGRLKVSGHNPKEEDLLITILPDQTDTFQLLQFARDALKEVLFPWTRELVVFTAERSLAPKIADAFGAAIAARISLLPVYGKRVEKQKPFQLKSVIWGGKDPKSFQKLQTGFTTGEGTHLARYLATLPPNVLNPAEYGVRIRAIAKKHGLSMKFYTNADLRRMGAGAFTAVDQGDPASKGGIWELSYSPAKARNKKPISLVGKGMCFDTGGYDVKINGGMMTMKGDMQGSAVALATIVTAAKLKLPIRMKAYLVITENHISPKAYKPDEVITSLSGLTIEIVNTDAEGRMILADGLTLASRAGAECVIDFATLTGTAVRAIGTQYAAAFTNQNDWHADIVRAGAESGERVWTFPTDSSYFKALDSQIADTLQCARGGPDHILAACFLSKFIADETPWVHVDLACSENEGGLAHVDSTFTGFGIRWALEFLTRFMER